MRARLLHENSCAFAALLLSILFCTTVGQAQTTGFTYQGRLTDSGTAANGNYDLQFALWDSLSGGGQVGSTQTLNTVAVSNGIFTVSLDFGANAFPGASRFLEISARPSGSGSFTLLTPRQPITSTPYAVRSLNASTADTVLASGVSPGSGNYIQNTSDLQASSNFNISGNGRAGGTLMGFAVNTLTEYRVGQPPGQRLLDVTGMGINDSLFLGSGAGQNQTNIGNNVFVGHFAGLNNVTGSSNTFVGNNAGKNNSSGLSNSFFGESAGLNATGSSNTFVGRFADFQGGSASGSRNTLLGANAKLLTGGQFSPDNATAIGANAQVDQSNSLVLGSINGVNGATADTKVGIGTTAPLYKLHVKRDAAFFDNPTGAIRVAKSLGVESDDDLGIYTTGGGQFFALAGWNSPFAANGVFINTSNGRVGISTNAPDQTLSVNGNASKNSGGTSWAVFSDDRLKTIKGRFTPGLKALLQLQPIRYQYKPDNALGLPSGGEEVGFSAQAVATVLPEAVRPSDQGYLQLQSDPILWTMLNAIKEQQGQIQQQQRLIERQQQQLNVLKQLACRSHRRARVCR